MDARESAQGLTLVIPAYNEAAVIGRAVEEAEAALGQLFTRFEILVIDDGSTDDTVAEVESAQAACLHTRLIKHKANWGYGAALRTGFEASRFDRVAFTDADCQFDLLDLGRMLPLADLFPVVVGFRADRKDPWRRRFLSRGYNLLARTLLGTGVRDCDCALKVFRREVLADLLPESRGFFVNTEMLTRARQFGHAVVEVPVAHRERAGGVSKVSLREVPRTFHTLLGFWWREVVTGHRPRPATVAQARVSVNDRATATATSPEVLPRAGGRQASTSSVPSGKLPERYPTPV